MSSMHSKEFVKPEQGTLVEEEDDWRPAVRLKSWMLLLGPCTGT